MPDKHDETKLGATDRAGLPETAQKLVWEDPTVEELDFTNTQAGFAYGGVDGGIYTS